MKRLTPPARGFTLIEVLVAMAIVSISFLGFQGFYGVAQTSLSRSTERIQLNLAAQEIMEQISNDVASGTNPSTYRGDLSQCTALPLTKQKAWCDRIQKISGQAQVLGGESRKVDVQSIAGSTPPRHVITVTLATQSGKIHVVQRRIVTGP